MFMPRFAPLVKERQKLQTVRPNRKIPIKVGDELSFRQWSGTPYASPQIVLGESVCTKTEPFTLTRTSSDMSFIYLGSSVCCDDDGFARADGFESFQDMVKWFTENHKLPFDGTVIYWK